MRQKEANEGVGVPGIDIHADMRSLLLYWRK